MTTSHQPQQRVTPNHRKTMVRLYTKEKMSIRVIARELGYSYGTVHRHLVLAQVTLRPRGGRRRSAALTTVVPRP